MQTTIQADTVTVKITANDKGNPAGKLADAELHFADGPLAGRVEGRAMPQSRSAGTRFVGHRGASAPRAHCEARGSRCYVWS